MRRRLINRIIGGTFFSVFLLALIIRFVVFLYPLSPLAMWLKPHRPNGQHILSPLVTAPFKAIYPGMKRKDIPSDFHGDQPNPLIGRPESFVYQDEPHVVVWVKFKAAYEGDWSPEDVIESVSAPVWHEPRN